MKNTLIIKASLGLCAAFVLCTQSMAYASCSTEERTAKAEQLAAKIEQITQNDPARAAQLRAELKETSPKTSSNALENACERYDQRIKELDEASDEVEDSPQ